MKKRIAYLFMKYCKNESTRKEFDEFFRLIGSGKFDKELEALVAGCQLSVISFRPLQKNTKEKGT